MNPPWEESWTDKIWTIWTREDADGAIRWSLLQNTNGEQHDHGVANTEEAAVADGISAAQEIERFGHLMGEY